MSRGRDLRISASEQAISNLCTYDIPYFFEGAPDNSTGTRQLILFLKTVVVHQFEIYAEGVR